MKEHRSIDKAVAVERLHRTIANREATRDKAFIVLVYNPRQDAAKRLEKAVVAVPSANS